MWWGWGWASRTLDKGRHRFLAHLPKEVRPGGWGWGTNSRLKGPKGLGRGYEVEERPGRDSLFIWWGNVGGDEQLSFGGGGEGEPAELSTTGEVTNDGGLLSRVRPSPYRALSDYRQAIYIPCPQKRKPLRDLPDYRPGRDSLFIWWGSALPGPCLITDKRYTFLALRSARPPDLYYI